MTTLKTDLRAVAYTRVSTTGQAEKGTSLPEQFAACCAKAEALGALIVHHCEDAGVSGALYLSRPGLQSALAILESGEANTLIIANLSRFSRDREHQSAIKKRVESAGGRLIFCDMDFADTPEGDLAFGILGSFTEYEKRVIRARTMKGRRERALSGIQPTRTRSPYGYHIVTKNDVAIGAYKESQLGQYVIVPQESEWVRVMYEKVAAGMSLYSLARFLNAEGVPVKVQPWQEGNGKERIWQQCNLRCILLNPVHRGEPVWGKTTRHMDEGRTERGMDAYYCRESDESVHVHLTSPAIVSADVWESAVHRIRNNRQTLTGNPRRKYLLSGFLRCPQCGGALNGISDHGGTYYICAARRGRLVDDGGAFACTLGTLYASDVIESLFADGMGEIAEKPETVSAAIRGYRAFRERVAAEQSTQPASVRESRESQIAAREREIAEIAASEKSAIRAQIASVREGADPLLYLDVLKDLSTKKAVVAAGLEELRQDLGDGQDAPALLAPTESAYLLARAASVVRDTLTADTLSVTEKRGALEKFPRNLLQCTPGPLPWGRWERDAGLKIMLALSNKITVDKMLSCSVSNHHFDSFPRLVVTCRVGQAPTITVEPGNIGEGGHHAR